MYNSNSKHTKTKYSFGNKVFMEKDIDVAVTQKLMVLTFGFS